MCFSTVEFFPKNSVVIFLFSVLVIRFTLGSYFGSVNTDTRIQITIIRDQHGNLNNKMWRVGELEKRKNKENDKRETNSKF